MKSPRRIAVIGSGPAGLMAADGLAVAGHAVTLFEKRKGLSWKLYIAGGSGLNISNSLPLDAFARHYTGPDDHWRACLAEFGPKDWIAFIEEKLGIGTFLGTSQRYFVETMHAALLVRNWKKRLEDLGVSIRLNTEIKDFQAADQGGWDLIGTSEKLGTFDAVIFALGGGSYEKDAPAWPLMFAAKGMSFTPFAPSNTGFEVKWPEAFLKEAEGQPIKNILLQSPRGERKGDLVITEYGLEGTPIYFAGVSGVVHLDLKPDLTAEQVLERLQKTRENLSPMRRAQKFLQLSPGSKALLFHMTEPEAARDLATLARLIKHFPLQLEQPRPLLESISSSGGLRWENLDANLMLTACPRVYCAGEMLDWDAPTGGFLIQACISQGHWISQHLSFG
ncbi:MAG TPA: TIGR03862 family flavoprotein [Oligoflexus sp.]|uniref:TIGR03862 family flavoprotein n=1 Tax=Oligoflexus sp. TaxID=1971216 RepID=UPI002D80BCAE|nr:TIGR03862 family flavoprotein [Oligoflexus sp.]HET9237899.1 TIGR03862 family flavoprotein [Oligoflexus sp.]